MTYTKAEVQSAMIRALAAEPAGYVLYDQSGQFYLRTQSEIGADRLDLHDFLQTIWSLMRQGLVYFHPYSEKLSELHLLLTDAGKAAANDQESNPDNSSLYIERLRATVPEASPVVVLYAEEALAAYLNGLHLACAVMLGVASEAAFLDLAHAFAAWLPSDQGEKLLAVIDAKRPGFNQKYQKFRDHLGPQKPALATHLPDLANDLTQTMDPIIELLRTYRNDAGHPTGKRFDRATMLAHFQLFVVLLRKMYDLKGVFDQKLATPIA